MKSNPISLADPSGLDSRAEPEYCFGVWCPPVKPPGGWSEEEGFKEWWEDVKDGTRQIGKKIKDLCLGSAEECKKQCDEAYQTQIAVCQLFRNKRARQQCYENAMALYSDCLAKCGRGESPEPGE